MKIYTRMGDDGTTGLLYGGRVAKSSLLPSAFGSVDEAQAFLGVARAASEPGGELDRLLVQVERDLWVLMAELATEPTNRHKLEAGTGLVSAAMVEALEQSIDALSARFDPPKEFVVPGEDVVAAHLDVARTVIRRAERDVLRAVDDQPAGLEPPSFVVAYLNRLSDLVWTMARWCEGDSLAARSNHRSPDSEEVR